MKSCYVVMRHIPNDVKHNIDCCVQALTETIYLAEKVIADYYISAFGEDGSELVCILQPGFTDVRRYMMQSHYKEVNGATYFTVFEEEIKDDAALL